MDDLELKLPVEKTDRKDEALAQALIESNKLAEEEKALKAAKEKAADKKHLKDLIVFGLENSSEPVIKNPVMRAALEAKPKKSVNYLSNNYSFEENFKKKSKNINEKKYPTEASPEQFANLAYNLEKNKQMQGAATNLKEFGHRFNENKKEPQYPGANLPIIKNNINQKPQRRDTFKEYVSTGKLSILSKQEIEDVRGNKRVRDYMINEDKKEKKQFADEVSKQINSVHASRLAELNVPLPAIPEKKSNNYYPGATSIEDSISNMPVEYAIRPKKQESGLNQEFTRNKLAEGQILKEVLGE